MPRKVKVQDATNGDQTGDECKAKERLRENFHNNSRKGRGNRRHGDEVTSVSGKKERHARKAQERHLLLRIAKDLRARGKRPSRKDLKHIAREFAKSA